MVSNPGHVFVSLDKLEALGPAGDSLWSVEGDGLAAMTQSYSPAGPLPPGGLAAVFLDVSLDATAPLPQSVAPRITITRQAVGEDGKPAPWPADAPVPATVSFTGPPTGLGAPPSSSPAAPRQGLGRRQRLLRQHHLPPRRHHGGERPHPGARTLRDRLGQAR